jgi:hypothetical protein
MRTATAKTQHYELFQGGLKVAPWSGQGQHVCRTRKFVFIIPYKDSERYCLVTRTEHTHKKKRKQRLRIIISKTH